MDTPTSPTAATTTLRPSLRSEAGYGASSRPPALSAWTGAPTLRLTMPQMLRWRRTLDPPKRLNRFEHRFINRVYRRCKRSNAISQSFCRGDREASAALKILVRHPKTFATLSDAKAHIE